LVKISDIGSKSYYTTKEIREYASGKGYTPPSAEVACLLREKMSDRDIEALGVWYVVALHEPIKVGGYKNLELIPIDINERSV
jgi:hypothetical protein